MTTGHSPRHVAVRHGLLPVLMLLLVGLLVGCGASTSYPSRPTPPPTRQLKGTITEFPIPTAHSFTLGIIAGPDGNLWFTENGGNKIGRITPGGTITEFPLPASTSAFDAKLGAGITTGPDGNLWFTEASSGPTGSNKIGRLM